MDGLLGGRRFYQWKSGWIVRAMAVRASGGTAIVIIALLAIAAFAVLMLTRGIAG